MYEYIYNNKHKHPLFLSNCSPFVCVNKLYSKYTVLPETFTFGFLCSSEHKKILIQTASYLSTRLHITPCFSILDYHYLPLLNRSGQTSLKETRGTEVSIPSMKDGPYPPRGEFTPRVLDGVSSSHSLSVSRWKDTNGKRVYGSMV